MATAELRVLDPLVNETGELSELGEEAAERAGKLDIDPRDVVLALVGHIGAVNGASVEQLGREVSVLARRESVSGRQLRRLITELRLQGVPICAHPQTGYHLAASPAELSATCEFLYQRALASLAQIARMKKVALPDLRGQLELMV